MRILVVLLLGAGLMAYRYLQPVPPPPPAASPVSPAGSIFFQSTDGGQSWQDISAGLPDTMTSLQALDGEVYLGSENGILYHSRQPEKGIWAQQNLNEYCLNPGELFSNLDQRLPDNMIQHIFPSHSGPVVRIHNHGFLRQQPGSPAWQSLHATLADKTVQTLLESANGSLFIGAGNGIYKSTDQGQTWNQVYAGGWVSGLYESGDALIGSGSKGLLQSTDGGEHWQVVLSDDRPNYEFFTVERGLVAARLFGPAQKNTEGNPLRLSTDNGATWKPIVETLPAGDHIDDLVQVGNSIFCSYKAGIARSTDGGKTWELVYALKDKKKFANMELTVSGKTVYAIIRRCGC